jgi:hypothetical protein
MAIFSASDERRHVGSGFLTAVALAKAVSRIVPYVVIAVVALATAPLAGQSSGKPAAVKPANIVKKTAWGDPDLQGVYTFSTLTPLQRPDALAAKVALTEAELAEQEERDAENRVAEDRPLAPGNPGTYNNFWTSNEKGRRTGGSSLIIDPLDGRRPPLTPQAQKLRDQLTAEAAGRRVGTPPFDHVIYRSWKDLPAYTQCLSRPMPRQNQAYNHGLQILQVPGYVVIHYESMHDVRFIPLDGRPHLPGNIRLWNGDSRGHWEGNTLVVDWTNFDPRQEYEGAQQGNMHFVERFTRVDAKTINYEVTVDDPTTWTKSWKFLLPWRADDPNYQKPEDLYEYACHEGNYRQMEDALSGSRVVESAAGK